MSSKGRGGAAPGVVQLPERSIALAGLQVFEPSAVLWGATNPGNDDTGTDTWDEELARTKAALHDALGVDQFSILRARGAAMTLTDAVAYLQAEAARVLTDR